MPPAEEKKQVLLFDKFKRFPVTGHSDSMDLFIQENSCLVNQFFIKLLRQASFARLQGDRQTWIDYRNMAAVIALKCRRLADNLFYKSRYQYYAGLSDGQLYKQLVIDYLNYMAYLKYHQQFYKEAELIFKKALRLCQEIDDIYGAGYIQLTLCRIYFLLNRQQDSMLAAQKAYKLIDKSYDLYSRALLLYNEGLNQLDSEFFPKAVEFFLKSYQLNQQIGDSHNQLLNLERLSICYRNLGYFLKAKKAFEDAEKIIQNLSQPRLAANLWVAYGNLMVKTTHFQTAIDYFRMGMQDYLANADTLGYSIARANCGIPFFQLGQYDSALICLNDALIIQERFKAYTNIISTLTTISIVYNKMSKPEMAQNYFQKIEKYLHNIDSPIVKATLYRVLGESQLRLGNTQQARAKYQKSLLISIDMSDSLQLAQAYNGLGLVALEEKAFQEAKDHFNKVYLLLNGKDDNILLFLANYGLARVHTALQENDLAMKNFEKALIFIERVRESVDMGDMKMSYLAHQIHVYDDVIRFAIENLNDPEKAFYCVEKAHARNLLDIIQKGTHNHTDSQKKTGTAAAPKMEKFLLDDRDWSLFSEQAIEPIIRFDRIKANLPSDACLVEFYLANDFMYVWIIDSLKVTFQKITIPIDTLRQYVNLFRKDMGADQFDEFRQRIYQDKKATFIDNLKLSNHLYRLLFEPIESILAGHKTLVIIPHEFLTYLPFSALTHNGTIDKPNFLIEKYAIVTAPSSALFTISYQRCQNQPDINKNTKVLAITMPLSGIQYLQRLSNDLQHDFNQPTIYNNLNITESEIYDKMKENFSIIHFGTHCIIYEEYPFFSYLILHEEIELKSNEKPRASDFDSDGILTAKEILLQDLSHVSLITLASCETALGKYYRGEGLVGLTFAFLGAGTRAVVSTLWKVDDRFTYETMRNFYKFLAQPEISYEKSLQLAQLQVIELLRSDPQITFPFPYYWAAFIGHGYCK